MRAALWWYWLSLQDGESGDDVVRQAITWEDESATTIGFSHEFVVVSVLE